MRVIQESEIKKKVKNMCLSANYILPNEIRQALQLAKAREKSPLGKEIIGEILDNSSIASQEQIPICQDTGFAVFFIEWGQNIVLEGRSLEEILNEVVREVYKEEYLRKSIVDDPLFARKNTEDNTPSVVNTIIVPGDKLKITFMPKGGGSENMSSFKMLKPSDGIKGVKKYVLDVVKKAGANPCPPILVGIGIGGTFEKTVLLAKKALLRPLNARNKDEKYAALEEEILLDINNLGIGPQGFGGTVTALTVNIEYFPAHIASLPVAVTLQCHAARHCSLII